MTRRELLRAVGTASMCGAATALPTGCASMPRVGRADGGHRCDSHYCRYYRTDGQAGRCALTLREAGGLP